MTNMPEEMESEFIKAALIAISIETLALLNRGEEVTKISNKITNSAVIKTRNIISFLKQ